MRLVDPQGRLLGKIHVLDLAGLLLLTLLWPMLVFGLQSLKGQRELAIQKVSPRRVVTGETDKLTVLGTGFDRQTAAQLGHLPFANVTFVNKVWIDIGIPKEFPEGIFRLGIRNGRGRFVLLEEAFEVVWAPSISQVEVLPTTMDTTLLVIKGDYFGPDCRVAIDSFPVLGFVHQSTTRLEAIVGERLTQDLYYVTVTNANEETAHWQGIATKSRTDTLSSAATEKETALSVRLVRPNRIDAQVRQLLILGSDFRKGCEVTLGDVSLQEVQRLSPSVLKATLPHPFRPSAPGWLPLKVTRPDGAEAVLEKGALAPPKSSISTRAVVVLRFSGLSDLDLARLYPDHPEVQTADENAAKTITVLSAEKGREGGSALVKVVLPIEIVTSWKEQYLECRGQKLFEGAQINVRIPGSSVMGEVASRPIPLLQLVRQEE